MNQILSDLSTSALAAAIQANLFEWYRALGRSPAAELHESPERTWVLTGLPFAFLNAVLRIQVAPDHADAVVEETLAHLRSKHVNSAYWWVGPDTRPGDLGRHLEAHGLTYAEGSSGMAVDLSALNEELATPSGLAIERVRDGEALRQWARTSIVGFGLPETSIDAWFDLFAGLGFDLPLHNYLGLLDGKPVATSELFAAAGVAGIYVVTTLPEARRQGIGAAMTLAPLREARALGYQIGILEASSMGQPVYSRLGFREYCRTSHYVWAGDTGE